MAENKTSFILYSDLITVVEKLVIKDREEKTNNAGELFLHILKYVNDNNPIPINFIVDMAFEPIKLSLKRDLKKYELYIEKQRINGAKGGRPKKTQKTQPFISKPKKADSVSDSDSVITTIYEKFVAEVKAGNFQSRVESLYMRLRLKENSLTPLLKNFKLHIIEENRVHKDTNDFFINFKNWLNVQDRNQLLNQYKK